MKNIYYLGPKGTYSEIAALKIKKIISDTEIIPVSTIAKVIDLVNKEYDCIGVLPIENLIDGVVRQTLDNIYEADIKIQAQFEMPIEHCFVSKNNDITKIKHIVSHPQALAQCQKFILNNFDKDIDIECSTSTAQAGNFLLSNDDSYSAIISLSLAKELNLNVLGKNIGDVKDNKTRFIVIAKEDLRLGDKERTSIVFNTKNEPGALLNILKIFNDHNLNLVYLESRPSKDVFGEYNFFADIDKGFEDVKDVLDKIAWKCNFYKLLGSYPDIR